VGVAQLARFGACAVDLPTWLQGFLSALIHIIPLASRWIVIVCERVNVARLATCMAYESKELYDATEFGM